jgi:CheY-like chemotaxis protein
MAAILVIDDEASIRTICRLILDSAGHQVREATNGLQGIISFRQQPADLILSDICMPIKTGLEVVRELRREFPEVKIVAMSGSSWPGDDFLADAKACGAVATLAKPFQPNELLEVVRAVLQGA